MEWVLAGAALVIIAIFIFGALRSERAGRSSGRPRQRGDRGGAVIATGALIAGAASGADDRESDGGADGGHGDGGGSDSGGGGGSDGGGSGG